MARAAYSLRWRIVALVGIPVVLSGLAIGALALMTSWHEIEEVYDAQLIHAAKVLRQLTAHELDAHEAGGFDLVPETPDLGYKYEQNIAFRIWHGDAPLTRSGNAAAFGDLEAPPGLSDQRVDGEKWRFFVLLDADGGFTVETSERYAIRYELIGYLLLGMLLPASLFIPVVLALVWYGATRGLAPLAEISRDVDSRDSGDLGAIHPARTPREIEPLVNALNRLLFRLKDALERERDFTDNAAHELRTPLAAIKTQAQALRRRLAGAPECRESLANLLGAIDRAAHMVDRLLAFSRVQKRTHEPAEVDLAALLGEAASELAGDARARGQDLSVSAPESCTVAGDADALGILIRNLVENSIKYTPGGGRIELALESRDGRPVMIVRDNGPGIAGAEKERVLRRFYRLGGAEEPGSGLGLAIARWIAEQHHAELVLKDVDPHGLACEVIFPHSGNAPAQGSPPFP